MHAESPAPSCWGVCAATRYQLVQWGWGIRYRVGRVGIIFPSLHNFPILTLCIVHMGMITIWFKELRLTQHSEHSRGMIQNEFYQRILRTFQSAWSHKHASRERALCFIVEKASSSSVKINNFKGKLEPALGYTIQMAHDWCRFQHLGTNVMGIL